MSHQALETAARIIDAVREQKPLVDCITNFVTVNDCANILLAFGASPAMCDAFDESFNFARISSALYINTGTYIKEHENAAIVAVLAAKQAGVPVVIDPVGCGALPKQVTALNFLTGIAGADIIKGNMGEIMALAGREVAVKGVDALGDDPEESEIEDAAKQVALRYACVVAATGKADVITDGERVLRVYNGSEMLTKITGAGCMAGALCGATAAAAKHIGADRVSAALAGILAMGIAGERAALQANLPGSYRVALMDSIYTLTGADVLKQGRLRC
ncbi:MAG: hydroxyethylthiazole kinase [Spirochaetaceae bacterium]|jgi:hydroxyethylthiazole kinase|nr:hydroxyethylthiazole kinase [Spirochaetaceae bacterium]